PHRPQTHHTAHPPGATNPPRRPPGARLPPPATSLTTMTEAAGLPPAGFAHDRLEPVREYRARSFRRALYRAARRPQRADRAHRLARPGEPARLLVRPGLGRVDPAAQRLRRSRPPGRGRPAPPPPRGLPPPPPP